MRKSLWSPDEDEKLRRYVATHGCGNWSDVAKHTGLRRCGKSCRLRWINYLRPDLKRGPFSALEVRLVVNLHNTLGNSWSKIATQLPGRTDNDVKNFWHSYTRSRRMRTQQELKQEQASNIDQHDSTDMKDSNDKKSCSTAADHHDQKQKRHDHEHLLGLPTSTFCNNVNIKPQSDCKVPCKNLKNSPQIHLSICMPDHPYSTLHAALSNLINFNDPSHQLDDAHTINPLRNTDIKPMLTDHDIAEASIYKGLQSHINDDHQSCRFKESVVRFQHFPLSEEASDDHNNSIAAVSCSYSEISTQHMRNAAVADHGSSMMIPTRPFTYPSLVSAGDFPAPSFYSVKRLPANHTEHDQDAAGIKPPEGLQSVIWSFLNRQAAADPAVAAPSDHYKAQYHHIKPKVTPPILSNHPPHQLPVSDQYTIEALSSSAALQYLQAQLADCFS